VGIVTCGCLCPWLVNDMKFGIYVFPVCKMILEIINLLTNLWVFLFRIEKGSLKCIAPKDVFTPELGTFLWLGLKIMSALYAEFLGFEANTYLAGITHDQDQISAFVSWVNITGILYAFGKFFYLKKIGLGFANVSRTTVSTYVGGKKSVQAKNSSYFFITWCAVLGVLALILLPLNAENIASVYSPLESIKAWIRPILYVFSIGAMFEMVNGTQNTILRVVGKTSKVVLIVV
jgi:Na+-driven multidrug efflux pump